MANIAHSLVRRAVDVTQNNLRGEDGEDHPLRKISLWGFAILWVTIILYMAIVSAVAYTYGDVVATLAMIETPTTDAYVAETEPMDAKEPLIPEENKAIDSTAGAKDPDVLLIKNAPITAKLRTASRHLRSIGGRLARFRGLHIHFIYHALYSLMSGLLSSLVPTPIFRPLVAIFTSICLCRIHMTWTHAVVSMPSTKSWWHRIPSRNVVKKVAIPTALLAIAQQLCLYIPGALMISVQEMIRNPRAFGENPDSVRKMALVELLGIFGILVATVLLIVVPAEVSLKRVEVSMLPDDDETIVPFDRSFAGKFKPESLGGTGAVSILDAWKTFGKEARIRLLKLYGKIFAIQIGLSIVFMVVIIGEIRLILDGDFERVVEAARKSIKGEL